MVVKSKIGRKRYIIFKLNSNSIITKRDFIYTLNNLMNMYYPYRIMDPNSSENEDSNQFLNFPWVILVKNNYGLVRCHHLDKAKTIKLLCSINMIGNSKNPVKIETLGTTGTIRSARKKYLDKLILYPLNIVK